MNQIKDQAMIPLYSDFNLTDRTTEPIAVTVYIIKDGKVLLLNQTKSHTVVPDLWVGIGGKAPITSYLGTTFEKTNHDVLMTSLISGKLQSSESLEQIATREVNEETGLTIDSAKLNYIGASTVRLLNDKTDELWRIFNYVYSADGTEGPLSECNEGTLKWFPISEIPKLPMHRHDKIIFHEQNPTLQIETVIDDINSVYKLRITFKSKKDGKKFHILLPSFKDNPNEVVGVSTTPTVYPSSLNEYITDASTTLSP